MGQLERQKEERTSPRKKSKTAQNGASTLWTFHPTKAQKEALRTSVLTPQEVLNRIQRHLEKGIGLSIGVRVDTGNCFVIARERGTVWNSGTAVSVWHSDLGQALKGLCYYLEEVNPDYPEVPPYSGEFMDEW